MSFLQPREGVEGPRAHVLSPTLGTATKHFLCMTALPSFLGVRPKLSHTTPRSEAPCMCQCPAVTIVKFSIIFQLAATHFPLSQAQRGMWLVLVTAILPGLSTLSLPRSSPGMLSSVSRGRQNDFIHSLTYSPGS